MRLSSSPRFASRSLLAKIALGLALLATPVLSPTASASQLNDQQKIVLTWKTSDSTAVIHRKLLRQARRACDMHASYSMTFTRIEQRCAAEIMDRAVARIGSVELSRHHLGVARPSRG